MSRIDEIRKKSDDKQYFVDGEYYIQSDILYLLSEIEKRDKRVEMLESLRARNKAIDPLSEVPPFDWGPMGELMGKPIEPEIAKTIDEGFMDLI